MMINSCVKKWVLHPQLIYKIKGNIMKINQLIFLILIFGMSMNSMAVTDKEKFCVGGEGTQLAMNLCADATYKEADAELNRVYKEIRANYKDDKLFLKKLKTAQLAWIKLRDADFALEYPHSEDSSYYGSAFPMCANSYKANLTLQRVEFLKRWLVGGEEGDVCNGSKKINDAIQAKNSATEKLCYKNEYAHKDSPEYKDITELNIVIDGNKVTGEYNYLPAERDQRFGQIEGTIDNDTISAKYTFEQEGQKDMESINIILNDKSAKIEGGDPALGLSDNIVQIDCK